jgi:hypothetical protein
VNVRRAIVLLLPVVVVFAIAPGAQALPIVGASANTIPAGTFMLDMWGTWQDYSIKHNSTGDDPGWCGLGNGDNVTSGSLVPRIYYGVADWLTLRVAIPFEDRYAEFGAADGGGMSNSGLGDIIIDPKIQILSSDGGYPRVAALVGVRFPTGEATGVDDDNVSPVSDGSTDYMLGAVATHRVGSITAHACLTHWMNGQTESGTDSPDMWVGLASIEMPLDESWMLLWEYKGVFSSESKAFYRTYACPGIAWNGERTTIGLSALVSAARKGGDGPGGYDFDWAPYLRVYYRFF